MVITLPGNTCVNDSHHKKDVINGTARLGYAHTYSHPLGKKNVVFTKQALMYSVTVYMGRSALTKRCFSVVNAFHT